MKRRSPLALTIRFKKLSEEVVAANSLSCETIYVDDEKRLCAHIFIMGHVTEDMIDLLIEDFSKPEAYAEASE